jgi:hypothetical protein
MGVSFNTQVDPGYMDPNFDGLVLQGIAYCELGPDAPSSIVYHHKGKQCQLFRQVAHISRHSVIGTYGGKPMADERHKLMKQLFQNIEMTRAHSEYMMGPPFDIELHEDNKIVAIPLSVYHQMSTWA